MLCNNNDLSLYSTATQNTWRRGLGLGNAKPKCKPVEYRLRWVPTQNSGVGHVHFMFFVLIPFVLGSQREPSFQWNMGLRVVVFGNVIELLPGHRSMFRQEYS